MFFLLCFLLFCHFGITVVHVLCRTQCMNLDKKLNGMSAVKKNSIQIFGEATSHEINTTIKYHDIIIFAQLLSECNNLSSGGMEHRKNS